MYGNIAQHMNNSLSIFLAPLRISFSIGRYINSRAFIFLFIIKCCMRLILFYYYKEMTINSLLYAKRHNCIIISIIINEIEGIKLSL